MAICIRVLIQAHNFVKKVKLRFAEKFLSGTSDLTRKSVDLELSTKNKTFSIVLGKLEGLITAFPIQLNSITEKIRAFKF